MISQKNGKEIAEEPSNRLVITSLFYHPYIGGVETVVKNLSEGQVKKGVETVVVCTGDSINADTSGVKVIRCKGWTYSLGLNPYAFFILNNLLSEHKVMVNIHGFHNLLSFQSALLCLIRGNKYIFTPHYHGRGHTKVRSLIFNIFRPFGAILIRRASAIVCVSEYEKQQVIRDLNVPCEKITIIPNAGKGYKRVIEGREISKFLYVGRIEKYKNIDKIIEALDMIKKENTVPRLTIVGNGPDMDRLKKIIRDKNLETSVELLNKLSESELEIQFRESSALVLLSDAEAYGLVIADALECGLPCIISNKAALAEFSKVPGCITVNDVEDLNEIANAMKAIIQTPPRVEPPSTEKILSWEEVVERYFRLYNIIYKGKNLKF